MQQSDGMNYAPQGKPAPVVKPGEFVFACAALDHGHIYGMANGLKEAGATLKYVFDPDPAKVEAFLKQHPGTPVADSLDRILDDPDIHMVASAAVTSERGALGVRVMGAGKDYFTDKAPFTSLDQIDAAKAAVARTGRKYMVYYSERLHVECAVYAGQLIRDGAIGRVIQVIGMARIAWARLRGRTGFSKSKSTAASCATSEVTR
jgi:predicted dehydrogenase